MAADRFPHLPPGREPGIQTLRNRSQRNFLVPFVALVGTGMYMTGVWAAAGGRGPEFDRQEELWGGILFALLGLMCVFGAYAMQGKGRPKRHPRLGGCTLSVAPGDPRRGERVSITFAGTPQEQGGLEVGLVCKERFDMKVHAQVQGSGMVRRETAEANAHEQWQALAPGATEQTFTFVVPHGGPYSYEGDCVSYVWLASARAVKRMRADPRVEEPLWVRP